MKRIALLSMMVCLLHVSIFAQQIPSVVNFRMYNNESFTCELNGTSSNTASTSQRFERLIPGYYNIKVYVAQWMYGGGYSNRLVYQGYIEVKPATEIYYTVAGGRITTDREISLLPSVPSPSSTPYYMPNYYDPYAYNGYTNSYYYNHSGWNSNGYGSCNSGRPTLCNPSHVQTHTNCGPRVMNESEFSQLIYSISNASFESTKLSIANSALRSNNVTTQQVKRILAQFSFESSKLDFAKQAYNKTIDKQNYFSVSDMFTFSSSTIELNQYIASR